MNDDDHLPEMQYNEHLPETALGSRELHGKARFQLTLDDEGIAIHKIACHGRGHWNSSRHCIKDWEGQEEPESEKQSKETFG